jgi:hypothetical protein
VTDNTPPIIAIESGLGAPAESQRTAAELIPLMYQRAWLRRALGTAADDALDHTP